MATVAKDPRRLRRRRRRTKSRALRHARKRRLIAGLLCAMVFLVASTVTMPFSRAAQVVVNTARQVLVDADVLPAQDADRSYRPLIDPNADPYDDGTVRQPRCKEACVHKDVKDPVFSSFRERTRRIFVPAPGSTGLLVLGVTLVGAFGSRRKRASPVDARAHD